MGLFLSIRALYDEGVSKKAIARRLGIDVRTVRKHLGRMTSGAEEPRRAPVPSKLDGFEPEIEAKVVQGLSAVQIYQDLCPRDGFEASYETVKRLVRRLRHTEPTVYCRQTFAPGEEGQVDFGEIGRIPVDGRCRRVYLFVLTLCFSRLAYYELVLDQTVPTFLGALRRAFEFLGGAPARIKPDNLRSAVLFDQLGQRFYQEDFFRFCRHYGTVPDAARPATPTDKGRVERDIGYAKGNAFRGRSFASFEDATTHLAHWRDQIASVRVHGTTRRRPIDLFEEERPHLRPLPADPYEVCRFGHYRVRKDCHVHVEGSYYSVPHVHVGERLLVRVSEDQIQAFAERERVACHPRSRIPGASVTDPDHYPPSKRVATREIHRERVQAIRAAGPHAAGLLHALRRGPHVQSDQLVRLVRLVETYGEPAFDQACRRALHFGATDGAARIERILDRRLDQHPLPGDPPQESSWQHDFPRPLHEYAELMRTAEVAR